MMLLLLACTGETPDDSAKAPFDGNFALADANNYSYTSDIAVVSQEIQLGQDFTVDWSGLTTDLLGHAIDPAADVDYIWIVQFPNLTEDGVADAIVSETLLQEDVGPYVQYRNDGATSALLSEFVFPPTTPISPEEDFTDGSGTWLVRATSGLVDNRMLGFMRPTAESTNHTFVLDSASAVLDFTVDLQSLDAFALTEELSSYSVDWSTLETHANGNDIELDLLDEMLLARFDGMSLDDIEGDFLNVETIAAATYTADIYGLRSLDLASATSDSGEAFAGFGTNSLWLLALRCTACTNPAPPFLTVIQVGE